jgi:hypothetical protein
MAEAKWLPFAAGAVLVAIAGTGLWVATTDLPGSVIATPTQIHAMQVRADAACVCARGREDMQGRGQCWADFEREVARYAHQEMSGLCEDSNTSICFVASAGQNPRCIAKARPRGACSDDEARLAQARATATEGC